MKPNLCYRQNESFKNARPLQTKILPNLTATTLRGRARGRPRGPVQTRDRGGGQGCRETQRTSLMTAFYHALAAPTDMRRRIVCLLLTQRHLLEYQSFYHRQLFQFSPEAGPR